jgi:hypothetical protein
MVGHFSMLVARTQISAAAAGDVYVTAADMSIHTIYIFEANVYTFARTWKRKSADGVGIPEAAELRLLRWGNYGRLP